MRTDIRIRAILLSALLLVPCFWQRRIEAGDLGSHIYNAWLASEIKLGHMPGLKIVTVTTNVLFDVILERLLRAFGPDAAQRIAVAAAVLIFFWGAFRLISVLSGKQPWFLAPCLMMIAYGWVFHMGFFNFYLATGLSLWALSLQINRPRIHFGAIALLIVAYAGHMLPVVWAVAVFAYMRIARRLAPRSRLAPLAASMAAIVGLNFWITSRYYTFASSQQIMEAGAVDQVWVFGLKYCAISILLALLWCFLLLAATHGKGNKALQNELVHVCILMGFGVYLLPTRVDLPMFRTAVSFVTERMTLPYGVMICAFLATASPPKWLRISLIPLALLYFSFLFADVRALNKVEREMENLTSGLNTETRVFTTMTDPTTRTQILSHILDRVCVGRCLSYSNYEPFSLMFRVRATGENRFVAVNGADMQALQDGGYKAKQADLPLHEIFVCRPGESKLCIRALAAGDVSAQTELVATPMLW